MRALRPRDAVVGLMLAAAVGQAAELRIRASEGGEAVWARFEVRGADGEMYQPEGAIRDGRFRPRPGNEPWYGGSFVARDPGAIEVPAGEYTVVVERGTEYERFEDSVAVGEGESVVRDVELERWVDMSARGWYSGDFHVHRTVEETPALAQAEGLNLAVVFTMWNKRDLWPGRLPGQDLREILPSSWMTVLNAEDERGGGAWMFHGLRERLPLADGERWFPAGVELIEQARGQRRPPWVEVEKPFWWEAPVVMALATPDSFGLLHNHFNQYGALANSAWGRPPDERWGDGREGFLEYSMSLNYRFWNLGFRIPATAGSASGVLPNPVGYNRVYVKLEEGFSLEGFYRELREGRSFVTNGPMLFFEAEQEGRELRVRVKVEARAPLERVEIVANGVVVKTLPGGARRVVEEFTIPAGDYSWVAALAFELNEHTVRLAHSQPVWLDGAWDASGDAAFFVDWVDELIGISQADAERFASEPHRDAIVELYRKARAVYQSKR